ncbi:hypothetical protein Q7P37_006991 [Cladosporium fusiforme]
MVIKRAKQKGISFGYCDTNTGQRVYPPGPVSTMTDLLPDQLPPKRKSTFYPSSSEGEKSDVRITCIPPLAQVTQVAKESTSVKFVVLLETTNPSLQSEDQPRVCLWHDHKGHLEWSELPLSLTRNYDNVMLVGQPSGQSLSRFWFEGELNGVPEESRTTSFTFKFQTATDRGWQWIKESTGIADGELNYPGQKSQHATQHDLKHFFTDLSSDIQIKTERPETDDTLLYSLTCPVRPAEGKDSGWSHHRIGKATQLSRWFSLVRLWTPWLAPRQGKTHFSIDKDGVLVSFCRTDGMHVVCLAISGVKDVLTTFFSDDDGNLIIKGRNDKLEAGNSTVLVAVADSFEVANCAVMYHARKVVADNGSAAVQQSVDALMDEKVRPQWLEEWYDGLSYCTWNGIGQDLTADKITNALDHLSRENINITNLIIDDNWQSLSPGHTQFQRGWTDFEANKDGFPAGLKSLTTDIRDRHPNIKHIAVWHAILGYWGGVSPQGWIADNYKTIEVEKEPGVAGGKFTVVAPEDAQRMYNDFYSFLASVGIDSVKTDAQFFLSMLLHAPDRRSMIIEYQDAWTIAHLRHFSSRAISCMSQSPELLFHSQLPRNKPRLLVRNSDDFFPEIDASHPWHIFCNAHNSLFTQHLNALPDWDMFQTSHPWASFHAAARAVSGGPIYFTDTPGKHNIALLNQLTAPTTRGKTVILRPHLIGKATNPYNEYTASALLKIATYVGRARTGTAILGVFNVSTQPLSEFINLEAFSGTESGSYIISAFTTGEVSNPMRRSSPNPTANTIGLTLPQRGWEILTAHPLRPLHPARQTHLPLSGSDVYIESNGRLRAWVSLKALGVLGMYVSDLDERRVKEDFMVMIFGHPVPLACVRVNEACAKVLEVDVLRAWREMGEEAGWSNEVSVEVFLH